MEKTFMTTVLSLAMAAGSFAGLAHAAETSDKTAAQAQDPAAFQTIRDGNLSAAERELRAAVESGEADPFQMLNLAYVYQKVGREEEAAEIYRQVMEMDENPYAALAEGSPRRVKSIARHGLSLLQGSDR